jgi:hypothetical protein
MGNFFTNSMTNTFSRKPVLNGVMEGMFFYENRRYYRLFKFIITTAPFMTFVSHYCHLCCRFNKASDLTITCVVDAFLLLLTLEQIITIIISIQTSFIC